MKSFTLAMVKAAINVSEGTVPALVFDQLVDLGMAMLTEAVRLLPDVPAVLADLARDHRLVLITKGDLVHQTAQGRDVGDRPPLRAGRGRAGEGPRDVRPDPAPARRGPGERFCMVGNSVRSDILPVLALGGHAVHIPYPLLWEHEHVDHDEDLDELALDQGAAGGAARPNV